ncbi:MAG: copper chaperone [Alphaproteobacteria bacterium]|nr:copper chaperone [Alphaproteobacteria bacterium]
MSGSKIVLNVKGMTCQGCVRSVDKIVKRADPQAQVQIDLPTGRLEAATSASAQSLINAINAAGYQAQMA